MKIKVNNTIVRKSGIVTSKLDQELVMMSLENGEYYGLDSIGTRIWELLENPILFSGLVAVLMDEFDVSEDQCIADVSAFLEKLTERKLIIIQ
jgi:hypothetical protein